MKMSFVLENNISENKNLRFLFLSYGVAMIELKAITIILMKLTLIRMLMVSKQCLIK